MSTPPSSSELTTRDVLVQIDRRLTHIEADLRATDDKLSIAAGAKQIEELAVKLDTKADAKQVDQLARKVDTLTETKANATQMDQLAAKLDTKADAKQVEELAAKLDTKADAKQMDELAAKLDTKADAKQMEQRFNEQHTGLNTLRQETNVRFLWLLGITVTSWLSLMATMLFKT